MKKQAFALIFANGINFLVNFAMNPFLARKLSYEDNATFGQINLINGYATILFGLGMASVINLLLVEYKGKESSLLSTAFWIQTLSGLFCILLLFYFHTPISVLLKNQQLGYFLVQNLPSTFLIILTNLVTYYYIYFNKAKQLSILTVTLNLLKIALVYYAVNVLKSLYYVIIFINILNFIQLGVHFYLLRKQLRPFRKFDFKNIQYVLKLSYPYLGMSIIGYSILFADGIIVSNLLGTKEFAIYRNGAIEIPFVATLYSSITAVALPQIVLLIKENRIAELMFLKRKISNTLAAFIFPVVFFCIMNGNKFIELYLGDKYIQSGIVFSIYNIAVLLRINSYSDILTISKRPMKIIIPNFSAFFIGLTATYILVLLMGINGAAISFVISILLLSVLLIINSCKELGVSISDYFDFNKIGKIALVCIVASIISTFFIRVNITSFVAVGFLYIFFVYMYLFKFNLADIDLLPLKAQKLLRKFIVK
jgi:O-antigen/teichoic acid export membrane protein